MKGLVCMVVGLACVSGARGQELTLDSNPHTSPPAEAPAENEFPTGDWGGIRSKLAEKGIAVTGLTQLDISKVVRGGADTDKWPVRYLLDLNVTVETEKAFGWKGGTFFMDFQAHDGPNASASVGDAQGFDNIDAPHFVQIYQLWYQQSMAGDTVRVKAGKIDANSDFSVIDHGKEFLHGSVAHSVANVPLVTYPDPAPGAEVFWNPWEWLYAGVGAYYSNSHETILDFVGHPEGVRLTSGGTYMMGEVGSRWKVGGDAGLTGHGGVGAWYHSGEFERLDGSGEVHGTSGAYAFVDQTLWAEEGKGNAPGRDVGMFLTGGLSDARTISIDRQAGVGLTASGFVPERGSDVIGVFTSWAHFPNETGVRTDSEWAVEGFYKVQLTPWASIKPDLQYIKTPGGQFGDALVATVRVEVDF